MRTKHGIAISGSHGKTTTTSMVSQILIEAGMNPTVVIGGHLKSISTNAQLGGGEFLVAEADESDKSLLHLQATLAVVTNIDLEHLETYKDLDDVKQTFVSFLKNLPFYGKAIICIDCPNVQSILPISKTKTLKYGIDHTPKTDSKFTADIYATDIELGDMGSVFKVWQRDSLLGTASINMPGRHNVLNALGAITVGIDLDIPFQVVCSALANFRGVERRFSFNGTTITGTEVFDDYGHHPVEIDATLKVAHKRAKGKLSVVFQPHRFSRTHRLWDDFVETFSNSNIDHLVITDIYPASESPIPNIDSSTLAAAVKAKNPNITVSYAPMTANFEHIIDQINQNADPEGLLLLLGAGKVNQVASKIVT